MFKEYTSSQKPEKRSGGVIRDGNMKNEDHSSEYLYVVGHSSSFQGYSGTTEFESFPLRQFFINKNGTFPNEWDTGYFNKDDMRKYIEENKQYIVSTHFYKDKSIKKCFLDLGGEESLFVYIYNRGWDDDFNTFSVCLLFKSKTERVESVMDVFTGMIIPIKEKESGYLNILASSQNGFYLQNKKIDCPDIDFDINYNDGFKDIHEIITTKLSVENSKGLVLLHGNPGSGKTTYIRYLINQLAKKIIYIPPAMVNALSDPSLIPFFMQHSNSILVVEDAENILMKRNEHSSQAISNILNMSDGLLSDCLNIQIVATFNADIINIDEALLRKGRLIAKYEFGELAPDRVQKLADKLGVKVQGHHVLSDIYNSSDISFQNDKNKIGFKP